MATLFFVHGAGGFETDRPLAAALGDAIGASVEMPRFADSDMSYAAWAAPIRARLATLDDRDLVVAHSFGASVLLQVLGEPGPVAPRAVVLMAMPDWGPDGWDVEEYAFRGPEPDTALVLHHCRDDDEVPFAHLASNAARLPSARRVEHPTGGHQFDGLATTIAADLRRANGR